MCHVTIKAPIQLTMHVSPLCSVNGAGGSQKLSMYCWLPIGHAKF